VYDELKEALEELDFVEEVSPAGLQLLRDGVSAQTRSAVRRLPDYTLLNYPPLEGKAPYQNFQRLDIASGLNTNRYAYYLGMGTGKTYIASALIAHYQLKWKSVSKVLMFSSTIGVLNVKHELLKFTKGLTPDRIGIADKNNREPFTKDVDIVICSYDSFRLVCEAAKKKQKIKAAMPRCPFLPLEEWSGGAPMMLILDEAHLAASASSQRAAYIDLHAQLFEYRYPLTGTPADKPEKLYQQLHILDPYLVHNLSYNEWLARYAVQGNFKSSQAIVGWQYDRLEELNAKLTASYAIFRETEDVVELPEHYIRRIYVPMSAPHRKLYEATVDSELQHLEQNHDMSTRSIVNRFPLMLLAVDNPFLLEKHASTFPASAKRTLTQLRPSMLEKLPVTAEILRQHPGEKGILWVEHPKTAEMLAEQFREYNPVVITGSTPMGERNAIVDDFQTDPAKQILIANIMVLNSSLTITAATFQVYVERTYAYIPYSQSIKRIYRQGQKHTVITYVLVYDSSLDVVKDKHLTSKGMLVDGLVRRQFISPAEWKVIFNCTEEDTLPS
jgi:SNF2 family DNA or RNA helicase